MTATAEAPLTGLFLRGLKTAADRPALHLESEIYTFEQVHTLALRWAGSLIAAAGGRPAAVAVLAGKNVEGYVGVLAAHFAGATAVPLHPEWPAARTRQMLVAAGTQVVLADERGRAKLREAELDLPVVVPAHSTLVTPGDALAAPLPVRLDDPAYVLFTSGSTGRPKGVPLTHRGYAHYFDLMDQRYDFSPADGFAQTVELNFDCAIFDLFNAWGAGACVHPVPAFAYRELPTFAADRGLTVWFSTPSSISLVRRLGGLAPGSLPGLRWSFFAGEGLLTADAADWQAAAPNSTVENLYGPTELTITVSGYRFDPATSPALGVNGVVPIGTVHPGHRWITLDGELCIAGPQMTPGYLDRADDAGRFVAEDGVRYYRTGDRVREVAPDTFAYLGRMDSQVQIKGWRIELAEIDQAVRACPEVNEAVAVTRPVDGSLELVVYYTGVKTAPMVLSRQLQDRLPQGVVPRDFRHLDALPLNSNRKVDRLALTRTAAES